MRRTLDSDEFQTEFPEEHGSFCDFFDEDVEEVRFKMEMFSEESEEDDKLTVWAWHRGELAATFSDGQWEETKETT